MQSETTFSYTVRSTILSHEAGKKEAAVNKVGVEFSFSKVMLKLAFLFLKI